MIMNRAMRRKLKKQKKEINMGRSLEEIKTEYMKVLTDLGDKDFRAAVLKSEIGQLHIKLSELNKEAAEAQQIPKLEEAPSGSDTPTAV